MSRPAPGGGSHPASADEPPTDERLDDGHLADEPPQALAAPGPSPGSFAVAAVVAGFALFLTYGLLTLDAVEAEEGPGPAFVPTLIVVLAWFTTVGLVVDAVRQRRAAARRGTHPAGAGAAPTGGTTGAPLQVPGTTEDRTDEGARTDWRSALLVAAAFATFIVVLQPLGWILAGTWLFWGVAQALGSRRRLFDLGVALAIASIVQLAFGAGLGLNLPAGVLGAF
ncbi:tripartite tricarboxylate transporter TctB family protein [uncultured Pseudokineococcus sp.]|uniref:tripartite tricarboxylate transporter TctB family protein n=1 Tax=uncultured Pseudokineococcus sp. TaxID=1642928 RepID=UPI00262DCE0F|nr:tripartite tricarboxylate transporter TctB family protein [uncultured Pseudokineococcus sp.]